MFGVISTPLLSGVDAARQPLAGVAGEYVVVSRAPVYAQKARIGAEHFVHVLRVIILCRRRARCSASSWSEKTSAMLS